jgi:DNA (cytosine-5)-methyltransferase 1
MTMASEKLTVISLFAGIGGIEKGFEDTGKFVAIAANEIDAKAASSYQYNNPDTNLVVKSVHEVSGKELLAESASSKVSILTAGFPCQPFSIAGYRKGFEDERGNVFWQIIRIVNEISPDVIFLENVKNLEKHDDGKTLETILRAISGGIDENEAPSNFVKIKKPYYFPEPDESGKVFRVLSSKDFGVPQNRERIFIIAFRDKHAAKRFRWPDKQGLDDKMLSKLIDFSDPSEEKYQYLPGSRYYDLLNSEMQNSGTVYQLRRHYVRANKSGLCPTLTANMGMGGHNVPLIRTESGVIRKLTPKECFRLMGYENFKFKPGLPDTAYYKQAGNAVVVTVIRALASTIQEALNTEQKTGIRILSLVLLRIRDIFGVSR